MAEWQSVCGASISVPCEIVLPIVVVCE